MLKAPVDSRWSFSKISCSSFGSLKGAGEFAKGIEAFLLSYLSSAALRLVVESARKGWMMRNRDVVDGVERSVRRYARKDAILKSRLFFPSLGIVFGSVGSKGNVNSRGMMLRSIKVLMNGSGVAARGSKEWLFDGLNAIFAW